MLNKTDLNKITQFEESALNKLMDILENMSQELLKTEDYLSSKTQSLHRLYLSYLSKFLYLKNNRLADTLNELAGDEDFIDLFASPMEDQQSSNKSKSKRNRKNKAKKNTKQPDLSFPQPEEQPSGLLCPPVSISRGASAGEHRLPAGESYLKREGEASAEPFPPVSISLGGAGEG